MFSISYDKFNPVVTLIPSLAPHHYPRNKSYTADQLKVRLGEWNLAGKTEAVPHQEIQVKEVLLHPDYHKVKQHYDVALLVLDRPAVLGATVNTICLPSKLEDYVSDDCVVSGWGKNNLDEKSRFQRVSVDGVA